MAAIRSIRLAGPVIPHAGVLGNVILVVAFSLFTALFAQLSVSLEPFTSVPITGQTFAVLVAGAVLGSRRGALSQLLYIGEGVVGLPVFAGGTNISASLARGTWGYLIGFVVAAFVIGWLAERGWTKSLPLTVAAMTLGHVVIFGFGIIPFVTVLARPFDVAFAQTVVPFIPGTFAKVAAAALALPGAWKIIETLGLGRRG